MHKKDNITPFAAVTWSRMYPLSCGSSRSCCAFARAVPSSEYINKQGKEKQGGGFKMVISLSTMLFSLLVAPWQS